jgi:hypothetical protein
MPIAQIRKAKVEDACGIAFVHVRSWQVAYRGLMPDRFLDSLDVEKRTNMWREVTQNPDKIIFIAEDKDAYYLPVFLAFAIATAFGLRSLLGLSVSKHQSVTAARLKTAILVLIVPACSFAANWPFNNRHHYFVGHDYVENILEPMKPGSLLLTLDWQVASPMFYTREVEHLRRDVRVIDVNLLRRLWYFDYLKYAYPELIERSHGKVDSFVAELRQWDADPKAYANDATLTLRIATKFQDMLVSFVTKELDV